MKIRNFLVPLCLFLLCGKCPHAEPEFDLQIKVINNSNMEIVELRTGSIEDTLLPPAHPFTEPYYLESSTIQPGSEISIPEYSGYIKEHGFQLFLFSRDTFDQVPWQRIADEYLILRRYDFTLDSLEAIDWTITYP